MYVQKFNICTFCARYIIILQLICQAQGEPQVKTECPGISVIEDKIFTNSQVVVNDNFVADIKKIAECAKLKRLRLLVASTSRCSVPDEKHAVNNSKHLIGMAIDVQPILPEGKKVSKDEMAAAWCAFHMNTEPCRTKYSNSIPQQAVEYCKDNPNEQPCKNYMGYPAPSKEDDTNKIVNSFMSCVAADKGIDVGATFRDINVPCTTKNKKNVCVPKKDPDASSQFLWKQDANHFQIKTKSKFPAEAYTAYQKLLDQFCSNQCSNAPLFPAYKGDKRRGPSPLACHKDKKPRESCFGIKISEVCGGVNVVSSTAANSKKVASVPPSCSYEARVGTSLGSTCKQFDNGVPLICADSVCVPAFVQAFEDTMQKTCDPLPAYIEDPIVYELERKAAITEDPGLLLGGPMSTQTSIPTPIPTPTEILGNNPIFMTDVWNIKCSPVNAFPQTWKLNYNFNILMGISGIKAAVTILEDFSSGVTRNDMLASVFSDSSKNSCEDVAMLIHNITKIGNCTTHGPQCNSHNTTPSIQTFADKMARTEFYKILYAYEYCDPAKTNKYINFIRDTASSGGFEVPLIKMSVSPSKALKIEFSFIRFAELAISEDCLICKDHVIVVGTIPEKTRCRPAVCCGDPYKIINYLFYPDTSIANCPNAIQTIVAFANNTRLVIGDALRKSEDSILTIFGGGQEIYDLILNNGQQRQPCSLSDTCTESTPIGPNTPAPPFYQYTPVLCLQP